jgi:pimeloyl-ACP methyl ester carboxylesterase
VGVVRHGRVVRNVPLADCCRARSSQLGAIGVIGWLAAMALALANLVLGGLALAWDGRAAGSAAAVALAVFAAGVTVSVLLALGHPEPELTKAYTRGLPLIVRPATAEAAPLEAQVDDLGAVLDSFGTGRAALFGIANGTRAAALYAASHPNRVAALVLHRPMVCGLRVGDYPWGSTLEGQTAHEALV